MRRDYLLLCGVTAGWGTIPVLAGHVNLPSSLIVAIRLWTAAACLGAVLVARRRRASPDARSPGLFTVRPGLCVAVALILACHWLALFAAYKRAPAGTVILIVYLAPIGVAALAPRILGEHLGGLTLLALLAATAGFALVAGPTVRSAGASGLTLSLVAAVLFVALIMASKPLAGIYGGLRLAFLEMAGAGLVLVPVAAFTRWPSPSPSWLWLLVLGVVHTALGITIYLSALARLPATHVGILGYLEPVGVVVCAWLWLGQRPAAETVAGGILVVAAGVLIVVSASDRGQDRRGEEATAIPRRGRTRTTVGQMIDALVAAPVVASSSSTTGLFGGQTLLPLLVLALGGALVVGNVLALARPPAQQRKGQLARPPVGRSVIMMIVGLVAALWAIATLTS